MGRCCERKTGGCRRLNILIECALLLFPRRTVPTLRSQLKKVGMKYNFRESPGAHTWFNWRIYLSEFAPMLFR